MRNARLFKITIFASLCGWLLFSCALPVKGQEPAQPAGAPPAQPANKDKKEDSKPASPPPQTPKTEKTEKKFLSVKEEAFEDIVEIPGAVESKSNIALQIEPELWAEFLVREVAEHGSRVKKGDVIIRFDTEKLEKAIQDDVAALPLAKLKLETAKVDLSVKESTHPVELEKKRINFANSQDDFKYFEEVRRPMQERDARENLKSSQNYLAYSAEELRQLKKMYENDQVTEETEEIILRRAQDSVDRQRWDVIQAEANTKRTLDVTIPREHENRKRDMRIAELEWQAAEANSRRELEIKRLEVSEQTRSLAKLEEKLEKLRRDLANMSVKAPADGLLYYGANVRGKWATAATVDKKLIPGGHVTPHEIIFTLADPSALRVRLEVSEDKLKHISEKQPVSLVMKWNEDLILDGVVESLSYVPQSNGTFDAIVSFNPAKAGQAAVVPGMNMTAKVTGFKSDKAIVLPRKAAARQGDKWFVTMKNGEKRPIETAYATKDKLVVKSGLQAGDEIEEGEAKPNP